MAPCTTSERQVRLLLVGDPGVGKTSLILSLVGGDFPVNVPSKAEEITLPGDHTPEQVPTNIVDFNADEQNGSALQEEINKAHVVCIVFAVEDRASLARITDFWLPFVRDAVNGPADQRKPVVLVGNKLDLVHHSMIDCMPAIMENFPEVQSCIECSAKAMYNIAEMFCYAQKAVLYPTALLYSAEEQDLTDKCKSALRRIFNVCDIDGDGLLNDYELDQLQRRCFNASKQPQAFGKVKAVLSKSFPGGIACDAVTLDGFVFLHAALIQRGRIEMVWAVLRGFGFNEQLDMVEGYLRPAFERQTGSRNGIRKRLSQFRLKHLWNSTFGLMPSDTLLRWEAKASAFIGLFIGEEALRYISG